MIEVVPGVASAGQKNSRGESPEALSKLQRCTALSY